MVALVLAEACLEKFGGDSVAETARNHAAYLARSPSRHAHVGAADGRPRVVLVGPPGSGKTTVGAVAGRAAGLPLRDTDADIEAAAGPHDLRHLRRGRRGGFRALERREVAARSPSDDGVLALGGGAVLDPDTEQLLAGQTVVFLDVGIADAAKRVGLDQSRPLLAVQPARGVGAADGRSAARLYERVADATGRHRRPHPARTSPPRSRRLLEDRER